MGSQKALSLRPDPRDRVRVIVRKDGTMLYHYPDGSMRRAEANGLEPCHVREIAAEAGGMVLLEHQADTLTLPLPEHLRDQGRRPVPERCEAWRMKKG